MIAVSRKDSKPRLVAMPAEDIRRIDEWEDDRDIRIKCRVTYRVSQYQESIMYSKTKARTILNQIKKYESNIQISK